MSEAGAGSDVVGMRTRAQGGDRYVLNGSKMWIAMDGGAMVILQRSFKSQSAGVCSVEKDFPVSPPCARARWLGVPDADAQRLILPRLVAEEETC